MFNERSLKTNFQSLNAIHRKVYLILNAKLFFDLQKISEKYCETLCSV